MLKLKQPQGYFRWLFQITSLPVVLNLFSFPLHLIVSLLLQQCLMEKNKMQLNSILYSWIIRKYCKIIHNFYKKRFLPEMSFLLITIKQQPEYNTLSWMTGDKIIYHEPESFFERKCTTGKTGLSIVDR